MPFQCSENYVTSEIQISSGDHVRGSPLAKVTLVGYGDLANPECAGTYRTVQEIERKMGSRLRFVFRCFPKPDRFAFSEVAAEAAECAASQRKFWEMHDCLLEKGCVSDEPGLTNCAREVGLDLERFRRDLRGHVYLARVRAGRKEGVLRGVAEAPTFFINSVRHESSFGLATLLPAVQAAGGGM